MANVSPVARYAFEFYKKKGLSDVAAAGFVGNLMGESQINPKAIRENDVKPGVHSYGIGQWNRERYEGLQKLAAARGTAWDDLDTQLEWGWQEMNTTEAATVARLRASKDVDQATDAGIMYERPVGSDKGPRNGHNWSGRNANARALLGMDAAAVGEFTPTASPATTPYNPTMVNSNGQGPAPVNGTLFPDVYAEQVPQTRAPGLYAPEPSFMQMMEAAPHELGYRHLFQFLGAEGEAVDRPWLESRTLDTFKALPGYQGLTPEWQDWVVENSVSPDSAAQKVEFAMGQIAASDTLDRGGWVGLGVRLTAGITDPTLWALEIGTGGVGATASIGSSLLRAGAEAGRQGAIMAGTSAIKLETTPNYSVRDLAIDSSVAMAAGGVFGALSRKIAHVDPTLARDTQDAFVAHSLRTVDDVAAVMGGSKSIGAAETGLIPYAFTADGIERARAATSLAATSHIDSVRIDAHAAGVRTGNADIVATMDSLMPDPVGNGGLVTKGQVDAFTWMDKEVKGAQVEYEGAFEDAFQLYLEEQSGGRSAKVLDINTKLEKRAEFAKAITEAVETSNKGDLTPSLKRAAEAFSRHNARVLKATQEAGYKPAQGFEHSDSYSPRNKNRENFRAMVSKFGYDGLVAGTAEAMAKESPDAMQTFASRFAHREARLEAGWAVDDARQDVINAVKDELAEDLDSMVSKAKNDAATIKAEKEADLATLKRLHDETIQAATDHATALRKQAQDLRSTIEEGHGVERAARIQAEVQELLSLADETAKGANE
ncbi:phage tail tip lysozyme [Ferirhizobium litorale]|uniref:Phage tail tip lysozyme n=1 Tax=Ferirhizobium litorale TaxID=2927786 RepID=A0AAE3U2A4_9HYPH|nr:phage tail tip lysozyme [Fererhizobium litorale]MDI7923904.1 phage tail tip lysozyme [Fererhizobium litorale]